MRVQVSEGPLYTVDGRLLDYALVRKVGTNFLSPLLDCPLQGQLRITAGQRPNKMSCRLHIMTFHCFVGLTKMASLKQSAVINVHILQHYGCPANLENCPFKMGPGLACHFGKLNPPKL